MNPANLTVPIARRSMAREQGSLSAERNPNRDAAPFAALVDRALSKAVKPEANTTEAADAPRDSQIRPQSHLRKHRGAQLEKRGIRFEQDAGKNSSDSATAEIKLRGCSDQLKRSSDAADESQPSTTELAVEPAKSSVNPADTLALPVAPLLSAPSQDVPNEVNGATNNKVEALVAPPVQIDLAVTTSSAICPLPPAIIAPEIKSTATSSIAAVSSDVKSPRAAATAEPIPGFPNERPTSQASSENSPENLASDENSGMIGVQPAIAQTTVTTAEQVDRDQSGEDAVLPPASQQTAASEATRPPPAIMAEPTTAYPANSSARGISTETALVVENTDFSQIGDELNSAENPENPSESDTFEVKSLKPLGTAPVAQKSHGISAAQEDSLMKGNIKADKIAGQLKELPGNDFAGSRAGVAAATRDLPSLSPESGKADAFSTISQLAGNQQPASNISSVETPTVIPSTAEARLDVLERLQNSVSTHAVQLREMRVDLLRVVLHPGDGLQLSLELHQRNSTVEVQATLQSGDFEHLNRHWQDLRQQLEGQGIRLSALGTGSPNLDAGTNGFGRAPKNFGASEELAASAFAEFAIGSAATVALAGSSQVSIHPGWQSWA